MTTVAQGEHIAFQPTGSVELDVDWVVVGSGAGGSTAALELARAGLSVALVESGPWRDPEHYPSSVYGAMRDMWSDWGMGYARGDSMIPIVQAAAVGGTTTINSAILADPPEEIIAGWGALGLGDVFPVEGVLSAAQAAALDISAAPAAGAAMAPHAALFLEALRARGIDGKPTMRAASDCQGSQQCLQGCKNGAKQSTNVALLPRYAELGGRVLSCARAQRVEIEGGRARAVRGRFHHPRTRKRGARFRVRARRGVVLAASATGTAPLLAASGCKSPALGKGWRAHPGSGVIGVYDDPLDSFAGATQASASEALRASHGFKLESLHLPLELLAARVSGAGRALAEELGNGGHMAMWIAAVRAEAEGSVRRGVMGPVVRYQPTRVDLERLRAAFCELARLHFEAGARYVLPGIHGVPDRVDHDELERLERAPLENRAYTWVLSHLFGGACAGADPLRSVVDEELCVRGVRGLHVACASVLPTNLGVNPQLCIMAVARLTAARLANQSAAL